MKKTTVAFLIMFALGCGIAVFAPLYLLNPGGGSDLVEETTWIAIFLMVGLGITAGLNIKRFFFAPIVPSAIVPVLYGIVEGYWNDGFIWLIAGIALAICLISMLITALVKYIISRKKTIE